MTEDQMAEIRRLTDGIGRGNYQEPLPEDPSSPEPEGPDEWHPPFDAGLDLDLALDYDPESDDEGDIPW